MKTIRLFDQEPYGAAFTAEVLSVEAAKEAGTFRIVLDRTLFFPEEGGQSTDTGILQLEDGSESRHDTGFLWPEDGNKNGSEEWFVSHVSENNGVIYHEIKLLGTEKQSDPRPDKVGIIPLPDSAIKPGDRISGRIDFEKRFSNMQNHTGEHILSGLLHRYWGSENVGFHLSEHIVTLDTSKQLEKKDIDELERKENEVVWQNLPVSCRYYDPAELTEIDYRSKKDLTENIRLATIPDVDTCACCAPHVKNTGEIGIIKIIHWINYKGGTRLTILSGKRAYNYLAEVQDTADTLALKLSVGLDRLTDSVDKLIKEGNDWKLKYAKALEKLWELRLETLDSAVIFTEDELDPVAQRKIVNRLAEKNEGICALFVGNEKTGYRFILSFVGNDAREAANLLKEKCSAKCGGSKEMIQGSVTASEKELREALASL